MSPDLFRTPDVSSYTANGRHLGFVSALKDGFGFIEVDTLEHETFFHFSELGKQQVCGGLQCCCGML